MNVDRTAPGADDSGRSQAPEDGISRRNTLTLAAAGLTVPLLPTISFAQTMKGTKPMSTIKVGQENSQSIEL